MDPDTRAEALPLSGRSALVLGLGRHDGGVETVRFLAKEGAKTLVSDSGDPASLAASIAAIEGTGATVEFGPQTAALLDRVGPDALVIASPAIPFDHPVLSEAARRGMAVTTEMNLVAARVAAPVIAVTGTKGKSTTTTMLAHMLAATGTRTHLGGNVGRPLVARLDSIAPEDVVVLEVSSFQAHWLGKIRFAPRVAVLVNLFPDHIDRHGTMDHYAASKRALFDFQTERDVAVLPTSDEGAAKYGFETAGKARRLHFGDRIRGEGGGEGVVVTVEGDLADASGRGGTSLVGFRLWGRHNRGNAAAAAAAAPAFGATWAEARAGAVATKALRHRLEPVVSAGGVLFVDDSIATTPQSAAAALAAVARPCVVLVGGKPKGDVDARPLVDALAARARAVVGIGTTGPDLVESISRRGGPPAMLGGEDLASAVAVAMRYARPGDAVLLSPGFSSLDQFPSFEVRGDRFAEAARALPGASSA